jgi:putative Mg2+ transporter-C (MgtC) family protein
VSEDEMEWIPELESAGRVAVAAALGLVLGLERERRGHDAGTRTFAVLASGAALFTVLSASFGDGEADASRIASQVVVGVGFLGAGLIFRQGLSVQNLTTAAALWTTAAIGVAAGAGEVGLAAMATVIAIVLLVVEPTRLTRAIPGRAPQQRLQCRLRPGASPDGLRALIAREDAIDIGDWVVGKADGGAVVHVGIHAEDPSAVDRVIERLVADREVESLQVQR